jgi:hypothetical protein
MGGLSIFYCLPQYSPSLLCSYHCRGLLCLKFIPRHFIIFWSYCERYCFPDCFSICLLFIYRKATDFYMLVLYPATLLKVFIRSKSFGGFLGSFKYRIICWQIGISWLFLLSYLYPIYFFLLHHCTG